LISSERANKIANEVSHEYARLKNMKGVKIDFSLLLLEFVGKNVNSTDEIFEMKSAVARILAERRKNKPKHFYHRN